MSTKDAGRQVAGRPPDIAGERLRRRVRAERGILGVSVLVLGGAAALLASDRGPRPIDPAFLAGPIAAMAAETVAPAEPTGSARAAIRAPRPQAAGSALDAAASVPGEKVGDRARTPRTEAEFRAELRALARSDPEAFGRRAEAILAGSGPACEQLASACAAYEERWPGAEALCVRTVSTLPLGSSPQAESVPQALVHWLGERALLEPRAREALTAVVWSRTGRVEPMLRIRALRALILATPEEELTLLAGRVHAEGDPDVHSAGRAALEARARPAPTPESSQEFP